MATAAAVVAGVAGTVAGGAAAATIGGGLVGALVGVAAGAIVGGVVGAAGYALAGEDPVAGLKAGLVTGAIGGGLAGWSTTGSSAASGSEGAAAESGIVGGSKTVNTINAVEAGTGNVATNAIEAGTGRIAGSGLQATSDIMGSGLQVSSGTQGAGGLLTNAGSAVDKGIQATERAKNISLPDAGVQMDTSQAENFVTGQPSQAKSGDGFFQNFIDNIPGIGKNAEPMSETSKGALIEGGLEIGGGMLSGYGQQKAAEEERNYYERLRQEARARMNNVSPDRIRAYGSLYGSKYA